MIKRISCFIAALLAAPIIFLTPAVTASAAPVCTGLHSIGIGGLKVSIYSGSWEDSTYLSADQLVAYDSFNPAQGLANLDQAYQSYRAACPADRVQIIGHSEGAALAHIWVTQHQTERGVSAVLIADPKRSAGPGGVGLAGDPLGPFLVPMLAGTDANFGSVPVLEVCRWDDVICNEPSGWLGYVAGVHTNYDFDAADYSFGESGTEFF